MCLCFLVVLQGSFLSLLQSLPVLLQGADGVPRLPAGPPQWAIRQDVLGVGFFGKGREARQSQGRFIVMLIITDGCHEKSADEKDVSFHISKSEIPPALPSI